MPNICDNHLQITGSKENLLKLVNDLKVSKKEKEDNEKDNPFYYDNSTEGLTTDTEIKSISDVILLDWSKAMPIPKDIENTDKHVEWCATNWGDKWGLPASDIQGSDTNIVSFTQSAWCPPLRLVEHIARKYKVDFTIGYSEAGMGLFGTETFEHSKDEPIKAKVTKSFNQFISEKEIGGWHSGGGCNHYIYKDWLINPADSPDSIKDYEMDLYTNCIFGYDTDNAESYYFYAEFQKGVEMIDFIIENDWSIYSDEEE